MDSGEVRGLNLAPMSPSAPRRVFTAALLATAAALAVMATRDAGVRGRLAALRADRAPRDPRGGPLRPTPLLSRGKPVRASAPGAEVLVDGRYREASWGGGKPSLEKPAWAAIRIGRGPSRVLLSWTSSHNHDYRDLFYGAPVDYRIETSADSTNGADGTWRTEVTVTGNPVRSRAHAVPFEGRRWIRLVVTRLAAEVNEWGLFLDEIDVHDLSYGGDDVWVFLSDSIGAGVFDRAPHHRPSFADDIAAAHPGYHPATINAGFARARTWEVLPRMDEVLAWNADAKVFAILLGANDADNDRLEAALDGMVKKIQAAGKIALVARIPFQTKYGPDYVAPKNVRLDAVVRRDGLVPGPDLYGWFKARPERLADGLHPDDAGSVAVNRLFAEAAAPLYPAP